MNEITPEMRMVGENRSNFNSEI